MKKIPFGKKKQKIKGIMNRAIARLLVASMVVGMFEGFELLPKVFHDDTYVSEVKAEEPSNSSSKTYDDGNGNSITITQRLTYPGDPKAQENGSASSGNLKKPAISKTGDSYSIVPAEDATFAGKACYYSGNVVQDNAWGDYVFSFFNDDSPTQEDLVNTWLLNLAFIPKGVYAGDTTKMYSAPPAGTSIFKLWPNILTPSQVYRFWANEITAYVSNRSDGLDECKYVWLKPQTGNIINQTGALNYISCNDGHIIDMEGKSYYIDPIPYFRPVEITLKRNEQVWGLNPDGSGTRNGKRIDEKDDYMDDTEIQMCLRSDDRFFPLTNNGDGTFYSPYVMPGFYKIMVRMRSGEGDDPDEWEDTYHTIKVDNLMSEDIPTSGIKKVEGAQGNGGSTVHYVDEKLSLCSAKVVKKDVNYWDTEVALQAPWNYPTRHGGEVYETGWFDEYKYNGENSDNFVSNDVLTVFVRSDDERVGKFEDITLSPKIEKSESHNECYTKLISVLDPCSYGIWMTPYGSLQSANKAVSRYYKNQVVTLARLQVNLRSDEKMPENTFVTLRNDDGIDVANLYYNKIATVDAQAIEGNVGEKTKQISAFTALMLPNTNESFHVYVDGVDTQTTIKVNAGTDDSARNERIKTIDYFTLQVPISLDKQAKTEGLAVIADNGSEHYELDFKEGGDPLTEDGYTYAVWKENVLQNPNNPTYTVTITPAVTNGKILYVNNSDANHTTDKQRYFGVDFYNTDKDGNKEAEKYRRLNVQEGCCAVAPVDEPYRDSVSFAYWKKEGQSKEFDFETPIQGQTTLLAHYDTPTVYIDGFLRTDQYGVFAADGAEFILPNVTLSGFSKEDDAITTVLLETENMKQVFFKPVMTEDADGNSTNKTGVSLSQGSESALIPTTASSGYPVGTVYGTSKSIMIRFMKPVSVEEAQDYIRENVIFIPEKDASNKSVSCKVRISASDGNMNTSDAPTSYTVNVYNQTWQAWSGTKTNATMSTGYYYLTGDVTCNPSGANSGLRISGNVYLYLNGYTLTSKGSNASGQNTPGYPGIYLANGSNLYVIGTGTVKATGGNASNGVRGSSASSGCQAGSGGSGGAGAGAGIGTPGGRGGSGGAGGKDAAGRAGGNGGSASAAGRVYAMSATVTAAGGNRGNGGSGGSDKGYAGGGGGGGGGGAGYDIGTGGAGGGGGGGGGSHKERDCAADESGYGGKGGAGGSGKYAGGGGGNGKDGSNFWAGGSSDRRGGSGGSSGSSSRGSLGTYSGANGVTKYTVTFHGAKSDGTATYNFTNQKNVTSVIVPEYQVTNKNQYFLGWNITLVGKVISGTANYELTNTNNTTKYQPGDIIKIQPGTYGNLEFKAVTRTKVGLNGASEYQIVDPLASGQKTNYYYYKIITTLDGKPTTLDKRYTFIADGKEYKFVSDPRDGEYSGIYTFGGEYPIYCDGKDTGLTIKAVDYQPEKVSEAVGTTIPYESLRVYVKGAEPESISLIGTTEKAAAAPTLTRVEKTDKEGYVLYRYERQLNPEYSSRLPQLPKDSYYVMVDGKYLTKVGEGESANCAWSKSVTEANQNSERAIVTYDNYVLQDGTKTSFWYQPEGNPEGQTITVEVYALDGETPKTPDSPEGYEPYYEPEMSVDKTKYKYQVVFSEWEEGSPEEPYTGTFTEVEEELYVYLSESVAVNLEPIYQVDKDGNPIYETDEAGNPKQKQATRGTLSGNPEEEGEPVYYAYKVRIGENYLKDSKNIEVVAFSRISYETAQSDIEVVLACPQLAKVYTNIHKTASSYEKVINRDGGAEGAKKGEVRADYNTITVNFGGNGVIDSDCVYLKQIAWNDDHTGPAVDEKGNAIPATNGVNIYMKPSTAEGTESDANGSRTYTAFKLQDGEALYQLYANGRPVKEKGLPYTVTFAESKVLQANVYDIYVYEILFTVDAVDGSNVKEGYIEVNPIKVNGNSVLKGEDKDNKPCYVYEMVTADESTIFNVTAGEGITLPQFVLDLNAIDEEAKKTIEYCEVKFDGNAKESSYMIDGNEQSFYTNTYVDNIPAPMIVAKGFEIDLPGFASDNSETKTTNITRTGYSFLGWAKSDEATSPNYTVGNHKIIASEPLKLYAVWDEDAMVLGQVEFNYNYTDADGKTYIALPEEHEPEDGPYTRKTFAVVKLDAFDKDGHVITENLEGIKDSNFRLVRPTNVKYSYTYTTDKQDVGVEVSTVQDVEGGASYLRWKATEENQNSASSEESQLSSKEQSRNAIIAYIEHKLNVNNKGVVVEDIIGDKVPEIKFNYTTHKDEQYTDITDGDISTYLALLLQDNSVATDNNEHVVGMISQPVAGTYNYSYKVAEKTEGGDSVTKEFDIPKVEAESFWSAESIDTYYKKYSAYVAAKSDVKYEYSSGDRFDADKPLGNAIEFFYEYYDYEEATTDDSTSYTKKSSAETKEGVVTYGDSESLALYKKREGIQFDDEACIISAAKPNTSTDIAEISTTYKVYQVVTKDFACGDGSNDGLISFVDAYKALLPNQEGEESTKFVEELCIKSGSAAISQGSYKTIKALEEDSDVPFVLNSTTSNEELRAYYEKYLDIEDGGCPDEQGIQTVLADNGQISSMLPTGYYHYSYKKSEGFTKKVEFNDASYDKEILIYNQRKDEAASSDGSKNISAVTELTTELGDIVSYQYKFNNKYLIQPMKTSSGTESTLATDEYLDKKLQSIKVGEDNPKYVVLKDLSDATFTYVKKADEPNDENVTFDSTSDTTIDYIKAYLERKFAEKVTSADFYEDTVIIKKSDDTEVDLSSITATEWEAIKDSISVVEVPDDFVGSYTYCTDVYESIPVEFSLHGEEDCDAKLKEYLELLAHDEAIGEEDSTSKKIITQLSVAISNDVAEETFYYIKTEDLDAEKSETVVIGKNGVGDTTPTDDQYKKALEIYALRKELGMATDISICKDSENAIIGHYSFYGLPSLYNGEPVTYKVSLANDEEANKYIASLQGKTEANFDEDLFKRKEDGTLDSFYAVEMETEKFKQQIGENSESKEPIYRETNSVRTNFTLNYVPNVQKVNVKITADGFTNVADNIPTLMQVKISASNGAEHFITLYPTKNDAGYIYSGSMNIPGSEIVQSMEPVSYKVGSKYVPANDATLGFDYHAGSISTSESGVVLTGSLGEKIATVTFTTGSADDDVTNMPLFGEGESVSGTTTAFPGREFLVPVYVPVRPGHIFDGWKCSQDNQIYQAGSVYAVPQDSETVTFTATWSVRHYTVTYKHIVPKGSTAPSEEDDHTFDGSEYIKEFDYVKGGSFELPTPALNGFLFDKWTIAGASIIDNGEEMLPSVPKDAQKNITLYANWRKASTVVITYEGIDEATFVDDRGEETYSDGTPVQKVSFYQELTEQEIPAVKRPGYTFKGWKMITSGSASTEKELPTVNGSEGEYATRLIEKVESNGSLQLTALWEPRQYQISYDTESYWYQDESQTVSDTKPLGDIIDEAAKTYKIDKNALGEETEEPTENKHTYDTVTKVTNPTNKNKHYTFAGWKQQAVGGEIGTEVTKDLAIQKRDYLSDIKLIATWEPETWSIIYSAGVDAPKAGETEGKPVTDAKFDDENPIVYTYSSMFSPKRNEQAPAENVIKNPTRSGYEFIGWNVEQEYEVWAPKVERIVSESESEEEGTVYTYKLSETEGEWITVRKAVDQEQLRFTADERTEITVEEKPAVVYIPGKLELKDAFVGEADSAIVKTTDEFDALTTEQKEKLYTDGNTTFFTDSKSALIELTANWKPYEYKLTYNVKYDVSYDKDASAPKNEYNGIWNQQAWTDETSTGETNKTVIKKHDEAVGIKAFTGNAAEDAKYVPTMIGYTFIGWAETMPTYVIRSQIDGAEDARAMAEEDYYITADYYKAPASFVKNGDYNGQNMDLYAIFEPNVQLKGQVKFVYIIPSIYDEHKDVNAHNDEAVVNELKLKVRRINVETGEEDKDWIPKKYNGSKETTITFDVAADSTEKTVDYDYGTYPRAEVKNGVMTVYRYEIVAEEVSKHDLDDYLETRDLTINPGEVNFTQTYAPDRFEASWKLDLVQGRADDDAIPAAVKVVPTYKDANGEYVDASLRYVAELDYQDNGSGNVTGSYSGTIHLPKGKDLQDNGERVYSYRIYKVGYTQEGSDELVWVSPANRDDISFKMGTTGVSKSKNKEMTGTITLLDTKKPIITVEYQVTDEEGSSVTKYVSSGNLTLDTAVPISVQVSETNLKSVQYYIGTPEDVSVENLDASLWTTGAQGQPITLHEGSQVIYVKAVDEDGNVSYFQSGTIYVKPTPVIDGIDPTRDPQEYYPEDELIIPDPDNPGGQYIRPDQDEQDMDIKKGTDEDGNEIITGKDEEGNQYTYEDSDGDGNKKVTEETPDKGKFIYEPEGGSPAPGTPESKQDKMTEETPDGKKYEKDYGTEKVTEKGKDEGDPEYEYDPNGGTEKDGKKPGTITEKIPDPDNPGGYIEYTYDPNGDPTTVTGKKINPDGTPGDTIPADKIPTGKETELKNKLDDLKEESERLDEEREKLKDVEKILEENKDKDPKTPKLDIKVDLKEKEVIGTDPDGNRYVLDEDGNITGTDKDGNPLENTPENIEKAQLVKEELEKKKQGTAPYVDPDGNEYEIEYDLTKDPVITKVTKKPDDSKPSGTDNPEYTYEPTTAGGGTTKKNGETINPDAEGAAEEDKKAKEQLKDVVDTLLGQKDGYTLTVEFTNTESVTTTNTYKMPVNPQPTFTVPGEYVVTIKQGEKVVSENRFTVLPGSKFDDAPKDDEHPNGWEENPDDPYEKERTGKDGTTQKETEEELTPDDAKDIAKEYKSDPEPSIPEGVNDTFTKTVEVKPGAPAMTVNTAVTNLLKAITGLKNADGTNRTGDASESVFIALTNGDSERIDVITTIKGLDESVVPVDDKNQIDSKADALGAELIAYLDINMKVRIIKTSSTTIYPVTQTASKISFTVDVPESLQSVPEGYTRSYIVLRCHDGKATAITGWQEAKNNTVTFASDLFSTYAIATKDKKTPKKAAEDIIDNINNAFDNLVEGTFIGNVIDKLEDVLNGDADAANANAKKNGKKYGDGKDTGDGSDDEAGAGDDESVNDDGTGLDDKSTDGSETDITGDKEGITPDEKNNLKGTFAILNLILTLLSMAVGIVTIARKKYKWKTDTVIAAGTLLLLILTSRFARIVLINWWTIAFVVLFIAQLVAFYYVNIRKKEVEEEEITE